MSFQAMAWASDKTWGGPSGRSAIYAIANHANDNWFCWAKQETLAAESEQSPDSIQRRLQEFIVLGMVRRIKLKRFGRRTHDFLILKPSPYFAAPLEEIEPFLPRGCDIMAEETMAAGCGSGDSQDVPMPQEDSEINAAADSGSVSEVTLPQPALDAAAAVRQPNEPFLEPSTLTQPLPQPAEGKGNSKEEATATSDLTGLEEFKRIYEIPCSAPERLAEEWARLGPEQRASAIMGARGVRARLRKNPKDRGIVGPLRFVRSPALWIEFSRYAEPIKPTLIFVPRGSDGFRAWSVLASITGGPTPQAHAVDDRGIGVERVSEFPEPGGHALTEFADAAGTIDFRDWLIAEPRTPEFMAWAERIHRWTGKRPEPEIILLDEYSEHTDGSGRPFRARKRKTGLRVPRLFPPRIDGTWVHAQPLATKDDLDHFGKTG